MRGGGSRRRAKNAKRTQQARHTAGCGAASNRPIERLREARQASCSPTTPGRHAARPPSPPHPARPCFRPPRAAAAQQQSPTMAAAALGSCRPLQLGHSSRAGRQQRQQQRQRQQIVAAVHGEWAGTITLRSRAPGRWVVSHRRRSPPPLPACGSLAWAAHAAVPLPMPPLLQAPPPRQTWATCSASSSCGRRLPRSWLTCRRAAARPPPPPRPATTTSRARRRPTCPPCCSTRASCTWACRCAAGQAFESASAAVRASSERRCGGAAARRPAARRPRPHAATRLHGTAAGARRHGADHRGDAVPAAQGPHQAHVPLHQLHGCAPALRRRVLAGRSRGTCCHAGCLSCAAVALAGAAAAPAGARRGTPL